MLNYKKIVQLDCQLKVKNNHFFEFKFEKGDVMSPLARNPKRFFVDHNFRKLARKNVEVKLSLFVIFCKAGLK